VATPQKYVKGNRATGARNKVSRSARLARKGLVVGPGGGLYSKRTGMLAGPNRTQAAKPKQESGFDPGQVIRDFFGQVAPQDNLFKQIGTKIKKST
jgi:hypothetical protein